MNQPGHLRELLVALLDRRIPSVSGRDDRSLEELCAALLTDPGEITTVRIGREVLRRYWAMTGDEKLQFFRFLVMRMDIDPGHIEQLAMSHRAAPTTASHSALVKAAEPPRQELLRRLNSVPGATAQLVAMRCDLLEAIEHHSEIACIDYDFVHLLSSWFNPGFLVLRPISWHSPASILEKIIAYEAVHAIGDWQDLRRRLEPPDRKCFAYFHPAIPDEPLIFVEVALCNAIPSSIQDLLGNEREPLAPKAADTAVFYSISNCQKGLRGVSFGNSIIKQVVEHLSTEMRQLRRFVTLSPIPGLGRWAGQAGIGDANPLDATAIRAMAARYIVEAKRGDGSPHDSVARFHLANGALVHDIHAGADRSENGLRQSFGAMVNYLYDADRLDRNIDGYFLRRPVAVSGKVGHLLGKAVWRQRARKVMTR